MKNVIVCLLTSLGLAFLFGGCSYAPLATGYNSKKGIENPGSEKTEKVVTFNVVGKGLEPENAVTRGEARIQAERAAVADGYRLLAEKLRGVYVDAYMESGRGTVDFDRVRTQTQAWLRGTEILQITEGKYGIVNARMQLRVNFTKKGMIWWPIGMSSG